MNCSPLTAFYYLILSLIYGTAFAGVNQGLKYMPPTVLIAFRMLSGFVFSLLILVYRILRDRAYLVIVKLHFNNGIIPILHIFAGGLMIHGVPHLIIAYSQQWVSSAAVQIAQPLSNAVAAIFSHFLLPDEPFTYLKLISLILSLIGVALPAIPSFSNSSMPATASQTAFGYGLLIIGVTFFGIAPVYMKWKSPNTDVTVSTTLQLFISSVICFIWTFISQGFSESIKIFQNIPMNGWIWPLIVGIFASSIAGHILMVLIGRVGSVYANFCTYGQIIVGVLVGVIILGEWDKYKNWEIAISAGGLLFIVAAVVVVIWEARPPKEVVSEVSELSEQIPDVSDIELNIPEL